MTWTDMLSHGDFSQLEPLAEQMRLNNVWTCPAMVVMEMDVKGGALNEDMRYIPQAATDNPLADVDAVRDRASVMHRGRWYPASDLKVRVARLERP